MEWMDTWIRILCFILLFIFVGGTISGLMRHYRDQKKLKKLQDESANTSQFLKDTLRKFYQEEAEREKVEREKAEQEKEEQQQ